MYYRIKTKNIQTEEMTMANKGRSSKGLFGTIHHYDEHGKKVGRSEPGLFGSYTNYDAKGKKIGRSSPGMFGSYKHYDNHGHKVGSSEPGLFGSYNNYDAKGKKIGSSDPGLFGDYHHSDSQGCYIATCIYGSYNCPQVWMLRRFRDNSLAKTLPGRAFIRCYYAVSPTLVRWFGQSPWFRRLWQSILDPMVQHLRRSGVEDTPYRDKNW